MDINNLTPTEALSILNQATALVVLKRDEHLAIINALKVLEKEVLKRDKVKSNGIKQTEKV